jgi:hypothetical protein
MNVDQTHSEHGQPAASNVARLRQQRQAMREDARAAGLEEGSAYAAGEEAHVEVLMWFEEADQSCGTWAEKILQDQDFLADVYEGEVERHRHDAEEFWEAFAEGVLGVWAKISAEVEGE